MYVKPPLQGNIVEFFHEFGLSQSTEQWFLV